MDTEEWQGINMKFLKPILRKKIETLKAEREGMLKNKALYHESSLAWARVNVVSELWGLKIAILEILSE